ncbi:MAG: tyrosine-type recombinase/integrase [Methylobacteriaceae bacterium]|nr:tyrosine-type recombinase/integrase [Methylobacteriaceae bacterium]
MGGKVRNLLNRNGRYFARIAVPADLREIVGKRELRTPLGPDLREATRKHPAALAALLDTLATARRIANAAKPPARRFASNIEIAHLHYSALLREDERLRNLLPLPEENERYQDENGAWVEPPHLPLRTMASHNAIFASGRERSLRLALSGSCAPDELVAIMGPSVDLFRERGMTDVQLGSAEWRALARMLAGVELDALRRSLERDGGTFDGEPTFPILKRPLPAAEAAEALPLLDLLEGYVAELKRSGRGFAAEVRWRPCFVALKQFLKHDDAHRLTRPDVVRWKEHLLMDLAPKTVRDVYLSSLKAVLAWAVDAGKLEVNVAAGVKMRVPKKTRDRESGFTNDEATAILNAVTNYIPKVSANQRTREGAKMTGAKRWAIWLCALTGARIAEICQLRKEDVRLDPPIPHIRITPEAGSVKTGQYRDVPIHQQLIDIGFLDFVRKCDCGPLFYEQSSNRTSPQHPSKQVAKRLATWLRSLGIVPEGVDPNHGWRHRLKTVGRDLGLDPNVMDAIQGHSPRTAGERYGDVSLKAKAFTLGQVPYIAIAER